MQYDEGWIVAYAMALEQKAKALVSRAWMTAIIIGAIALLALISVPLGAQDAQRNSFIFFVALGTIGLGFFLANRAEAKAAMIRLQAHQALCQVQIERNTRK
ncbi:hypothetical protein [Dechloromonas sp. HYN0024]|uniref:hypothetical protein n=1 Tax=Dechloromonas sp. HYN0024 TaxID=2231055 RepID=UPI000E4379C8|nr:hypothetical protein [Dechloromonas sp. HYN0024]AXS79852.1 hypothetical protein HYN24_07380 [Dechloromonas sp. HYN0024]